MRVLMFGWEFPPHNSGGLGVACMGLTNSLLSQNVEVIFVLPRKMDITQNGARFKFAELPAAKIKVKHVQVALQPYLTSKSYLEQFTDGTPSQDYSSTLIDEVKRYAALGGQLAQGESFDLIHAHDWLSFGAGIAAKRATGKPLVVHIHATEIDRGGGLGINEEIFKLEKEGFDQADLIVAVSEYTRQSVINNYGIAAEKVVVVHNGIDQDSTEIADKEHKAIMALKAAGNKVVLFLGRFTAMKGADNFIKAAKQVLEYNPKVVFVMAGAGDMEEQLIRMAADYGIADRVMFTGFLRGLEKAQMYKSADLFVMPSVSEPFGIVPLESLINGTPVLISKQSGVSEVLKHSLKVDFWDVDEMTNKILAVLNHSPLHQNLSQNGRMEVGSITWNKAATKMRSMYQQVTGLLA